MARRRDRRRGGVFRLNQGSSSFGRRSVFSLNQPGGTFGAGRPAGGGAGAAATLAAALGAPAFSVQGAVSDFGPALAAPGIQPPEQQFGGGAQSPIFPQIPVFPTFNEHPVSPSLSPGGVSPTFATTPHFLSAAASSVAPRPKKPTFEFF